MAQIYARADSADSPPRVRRLERRGPRLTQKKQRTLHGGARGRRAHEGPEERERRPPRAPQGDSQGRRRAGRRRDVGRHSAAAARGGAGAGLRAHHDDEALALLGAARELAGRGAGGDPRRRRVQAREARAGLERDEERKQREEARVVEPLDLRGVQHGHGEAQQRVENDAHREDVPPEHDAVRHAHREDRVEHGERAEEAARDVGAVVRVREEHHARVQRDGRPHCDLLRAAREARVHVQRQVRREEEVHVPRERVPILRRALHAVRERHGGGAEHRVRGRGRPLHRRAMRRVRAGAVAARLDLAREVPQADVLAVQRDVENVHAHARFERR